jgi:hypothetical protein
MVMDRNVTAEVREIFHVHFKGVTALLLQLQRTWRPGGVENPINLKLSDPLGVGALLTIVRSHRCQFLPSMGVVSPSK